MNILSRILLTLAAWPLSQAAHALPTGHHGATVTQCTDPQFYKESPGDNARVAHLESFTFTASDNTDPASIKVLVNLQPAEITVTPQRSGVLEVSARLPVPIQQGRAWIKVTGMSHDGCDQIHTWNVYAGSDGQQLP